MMPKSILSLAALACALMATTSARAADVSYERLLNPDKEPQNWLMNHRDFGAQRFSPLAAKSRWFMSQFCGSLSGLRRRS